MGKDKNRTGREVRKPKKAKPSAKPVTTTTDRVPGKTATPSSQDKN